MELCISRYSVLNAKIYFAGTALRNGEKKKNTKYKNILSNLKFKCKNGCDIQIPYNDLREHYEEKCPKLDFKPKYESLLSQFIFKVQSLSR